MEKKANTSSRSGDDTRVQCHECGQEMKTEDRQVNQSYRFLLLV